jgi:gluconolactonase
VALDAFAIKTYARQTNNPRPHDAKRQAAPLLPRAVEARLLTVLPEALHYRGEPTEWVRTTRPGRRLHSFLEAPCFDGDGNLWLVDVPHGRLFRVDPTGNWTLAYQYDGEPHGLARLGDGHFALTDYRLGLLAFDPAGGGHRTLCDRVNTEAFRGLSDITGAPNGDLWFTDPGRSSLSDPTGRLFRLRAGHTKPELILANIPYPNGVAVSPDGVFVYVAATRQNAVWRLLAEAPDPVYPMVGVYLHLSGGLGPDGLAVDAKGRLAVAQSQAGRAWLYDRHGDALLRVDVPDGTWTTAVAFSPDGRFLIIVEAERGALYRLDLQGIS